MAGQKTITSTYIPPLEPPPPPTPPEMPGEVVGFFVTGSTNPTSEGHYLKQEEQYNGKSVFKMFEWEMYIWWSINLSKWVLTMVPGNIEEGRHQNEWGYEGNYTPYGTATGTAAAVAEMGD